jgi:SulP family sulfate permease
MVLAAVFFITRVSQLTGIRGMPNPDAPRVHVYELYGTLFFGAAQKIEPLLALADPANPVRVIVLDMHRVLNVDTTALEILETLQGKLARGGKKLLIAAAHEQPMSLFRRSGFSASVGEENFLPDLTSALQRARSLAATA